MCNYDWTSIKYIDLAFDMDYSHMDFDSVSSHIDHPCNPLDRDIVDWVDHFLMQYMFHRYDNQKLIDMDVLKTVLKDTTIKRNLFVLSFFESYHIDRNYRLYYSDKYKQVL